MTCSPPSSRSTSTSTPSWPTTWPWSSAIYALADQPFDDRARAAVATYLDGHQRNRHGGLIYDLADFDLTEGDLRRRTRGYTDHFGVTLGA